MLCFETFRNGLFFWERPLKWFGLFILLFFQLAASCMRGFVQTGQLCSWMFLVTTVALPPTTIVQIHLESVSPQGQGNSRTSVLPMNPCGLLFKGGNAAFGRFECAPQLVGNWLYCLKYFSAYCLFSERY
jgi:hypothetical protein